MQYRVFRTILVSLVAIALLTPTLASGAPPAQIHQDAADGSIDGAYSMGDLRDANRDVSSEQREYYAWDDAYREKLRQLATPAPVSRGSASRAGGGGDGGASNGARSVVDSIRRSDDARKQSIRAKSPKDKPVSTDRPHDLRSSSKGAPIDLDAEDAGSVRASMSGTPSLLWLLAILPLLVLVEGVRRTLRARRARQTDRVSLH